MLGLGGALVTLMEKDEGTASGTPSHGGSIGVAPAPSASSRNGTGSAPDAASDRGGSGAIPLAALVERYEADGFCFPIRVIGEGEAAVHLARVVEMEKAGSDRRRFLRGKAHLACRFIDELGRTPAILDCVEQILGPDILLWGSSCFVKAPRSPSYVSWHQDLNYWGLDSTDEVSAWIALSESNESNGCMRFVPGSHRLGPIRHDDTFEQDNLLTRGQELAVEVDEHEAVSVCLAPGEMSLHHGRMFHSSGPNTSKRWRAGLALRYIRPSTRQIVGVRDFAQLVRGEDRFGHFDVLPRPRDDDDPAAMRRFDFVDGATQSIFFSNAAWLSEPSAAPAGEAAAEEPDASSAEEPGVPSTDTQSGEE